MSAAVFRLSNTIQPYAWGSRTELPRILGRAPDGTPQAELWLGAHPVAPSKLPSGQSLEAWLAEAPRERLGEKVLARFGPTLPFLFKVLAADEALSLQAHPSLEQAKEGFAREEAAGVDRKAGHRNYRDANHKPEIICALTPFEALCGSRRVADTIELFDAFGLDTSTLRTAGLGPYFRQLMSLDASTRTKVVEQAVTGAKAAAARFPASSELVLRLANKYPGDVGVVGALLLNHLTLQPGEALYLGAGNLHAYLKGTGVELMANSDNVLRGGLTPKHVDVPELMKVLHFTDGPPEVLRAGSTPLSRYPTPVEDFALSRLKLDGTLVLEAGAPRIVLCLEGSLRLGELTLGPGESVFVSASERVKTEGNALAYLAAPGLS